LTIHKQTVLLHPIVDEFYNDDPTYDRSSVYALSKGLAPPAVVTPKKNAAKVANVPTKLDVLAQNVTQLELAS
jgi:glutamine amidotransferase